MIKKIVRLLALVFVVSSLTVALLPPVAHANGPDWQPLDCGTGDPRGDESPASTDLVGDVGSGYYTAYFAYDSDYLYFRERVDGDPRGAHPFKQYAWTMLIQTPWHESYYSPFQYQYMVTLNGNYASGAGGTDTVQLWLNSTPQDIVWDPIFQDWSETLLKNLLYTSTGPFGGYLASGELAGSSIGGDADYFVNWAIPISELENAGMITSWTQLAGAKFMPATGTQGNSFNKDYLNCPFLPQAQLDIDKTVDPEWFYWEVPRPNVVYTIVVTNVDPYEDALGVVVEDDDFADCLTFTTGCVVVDPSSGSEVVSEDPLKVKIDSLAANGGQATITITAGSSGCNVKADHENWATAYATNAAQVTDNALLELIDKPTSVGLASLKAHTGGGAASPYRIVSLLGVAVLGLAVAVGIGRALRRRD